MHAHLCTYEALIWGKRVEISHHEAEQACPLTRPASCCPQGRFPSADPALSTSWWAFPPSLWSGCCTPQHPENRHRKSTAGTILYVKSEKCPVLKPQSRAQALLSFKTKYVSSSHQNWMHGQSSVTFQEYTSHLCEKHAKSWLQIQGIRLTPEWNRCGILTSASKICLTLEWKACAILT